MTSTSASHYGTDAIGGVINFILRKDYTGFEASAFIDATEAGGGNIVRASLPGGLGNLAADGYNVMVSLTHDQQKMLSGGERAFSNGFQPDRGLSPDTTGTPFATQTGPGRQLQAARQRRANLQPCQPDELPGPVRHHPRPVAVPVGAVGQAGLCQGLRL